MGGGRGREGAAACEDAPRGAEDSDDHIYHLPNDGHLDHPNQNTNVNWAPMENDDIMPATLGRESLYKSSDYDDAGKALQL
jgi:hypothetical protein